MTGLCNAFFRRRQSLRAVSGVRTGAERKMRQRAQVLRRASMIETLEGRQLYSTVYGVTTTNHLITFDSSTPGTIATNVPLVVPNGENVVGIDVRPADGMVYAVTDASNLYTVDTTTGVLTAVGASAFTTPLNGTAYGMDFNPVNDTLRIISNADQDNEIDPTTGNDTGTLVSGVAYVQGDPNHGANPNIVGIAVHE